MATETQSRQRDAASSQNESLHTFNEETGVEVDQQTNTFAGQSHIGEQLRFEYTVEAFDALDFDDHSIVNDQINPICAQEMALVERWNRYLSFVLQSHVLQFDAHRGFIHGFEESWSDDTMDSDAPADNSYVSALMSGSVSL